MSRIVASPSDLNAGDYPEGNPQTSNLDVDLEGIDLPLKSEVEQKKLQENSQAVRRFVEEHLRKIDASRASVREANIDPADKQKVREAVEKIWKKITDLLNRSHVAAYRMAAWVGLLVHMFKGANPEDFYDAMRHLDHMVKNKYLIEVNPEEKEKAALYAWKRGFRVPPHACFGRPEFEEVKRELADMVKRTMAKVIKRRDTMAKELQAEATLKPEEAFKEGSEGTAFLYIPPQVSLKEGKARPYQGGFMLVERKQDGRIFPVKGVGSFENDFQEAYASGVFVKDYTVDWDFPPGRNKLLDAGLNQEQADGFYLFWNLLKRAKDRLGKDDRYREEKLSMARGVEVSEEAFFLEGQEGTTLVDFEGVWENWTIKDGKKHKEETITNLFFLVERRGHKIRVVGCPEHLKIFFASCMDSYKEGEKFMGAPQPLQAVLQAQYGACQTKALIA